MKGFARKKKRKEKPIHNIYVRYWKQKEFFKKTREKLFLGIHDSPSFHHLNFLSTCPQEKDQNDDMTANLNFEFHSTSDDMKNTNRQEIFGHVKIVLNEGQIWSGQFFVVGYLHIQKLTLSRTTFFIKIEQRTKSSFYDLTKTKKMVTECDSGFGRFPNKHTDGDSDNTSFKFFGIRELSLKKEMKKNHKRVTS